MKRAGVIGYPLGHSLSPAIFQAAFDAAGLDARYEKWETEADQLEGRVNALRHDDFLGANVTIPHKEAVVPLLDRLDETAQLIGAVNTIAHESGQLAGYNTDVAGFARALRDDAGFDAKGKRVELTLAVLTVFPPLIIVVLLIDRVGKKRMLGVFWFQFMEMIWLPLTIWGLVTSRDRRWAHTEHVAAVSIGEMDLSRERGSGAPAGDAENTQG